MVSKQRVHVTVEENTRTCVFSSLSGVVKAIASDFAVHLAISARAWNVYPWQVLGKNRGKNLNR